MMSKTHKKIQRPYQIILWGATGFTGQLVAQELFKLWADSKQVANSKNSFTWAIAGRSIHKLQQLKEQWLSIDDRSHEIGLIQAHLDDEKTLTQMTQQCVVLCSTVGPYAYYGTPIIQACVETETDYCDLTGETQWIRHIIDDYHETAKVKKIRLVNACGYDSIPSDLGTYMIQEAMQKTYGHYASQVCLLTGKTKGGVSGGTIASMLNVVTQAQDRSIARIIAHPYALSPDRDTHGPDRRDQMNVKYSALFNSWSSPFVMAAINTRIVRRSHALSNLPYGTSFTYQEAMGWGKGFKSAYRAYIFTYTLGLFMLLIKYRWSRALLCKYILPKPGEGPTSQEQEAGCFTMHLHAQSETARMQARIYHPRDPGYGSTAIMLAQSALCLALDRDQLPQTYGVLTPATAMNRLLIDRLRNIGMTWEITDSE